MKQLKGIVDFKINGVSFQAQTYATYNIGEPERESELGTDGVHGYSEKPQVPFLEIEITKTPDLDTKSLVTMVDETVSVKNREDELVVIRNAWFVGSGDVEGDSSKIKLRFESQSKVEEIRL